MPRRLNSTDHAVWHVLSENSVPVAEIGRALSRLVPVVSWVPQMTASGILQDWTRRETVADTNGLHRVLFPLQRGYTRLPGQLGAVTFRHVLKMLLRHTPMPARSVLVCTSSFWAETARLWPGPVVYYATDRTADYTGLNSRSVLAADRAMCDIADLVFPNSTRLADYLQADALCPAGKVIVLPNATRAANLRYSGFERPDAMPLDASHLPRPIAGVIGNTGNNVNWELVAEAMEQAPDWTWLFVGPVPKSLVSRSNGQARMHVMQSSRAYFTGARPHQELYRYARALDAAVMPYHRVEPTYSGSATRFYEHLAAGRPMLATRGVHELLSKEPLLKLVDSGEELGRALRQLQAQPSDGLEATRCLASRTETWEARAARMFEAVNRVTTTAPLEANADPVATFASGD